ncbi:hypothetical protein CDIOL_37590 [Clostridium diolis]|uniref:Uncharacterized protein n=1 Tax=Clostridium diolis TaxID=223919 RepID=A0AAV3W4F7_9CLOT|nr:hypothetical protein CDIOL_37590 [Clostridium diolis]
MPVDIVVAYGESTSLRNEDTCIDATKEIITVTTILEILFGINPTIIIVKISIIKTICV